jgi:hypothetical protein
VKHNARATRANRAGSMDDLANSAWLGLWVSQAFGKGATRDGGEWIGVCGGRRPAQLPTGFAAACALARISHRRSDFPDRGRGAD